jgi:hypothetical protein
MMMGALLWFFGIDCPLFLLSIIVHCNSYVRRRQQDSIRSCPRWGERLTYVPAMEWNGTPSKAC